jgi:hypothetical protein
VSANNPRSVPALRPSTARYRSVARRGAAQSTGNTLRPQPRQLALGRQRPLFGVCRPLRLGLGPRLLLGRRRAPIRLAPARQDAGIDRVVDHAVRLGLALEVVDAEAEAGETDSRSYQNRTRTVTPTTNNVSRKFSSGSGVDCVSGCGASSSTGTGSGSFPQQHASRYFLAFAQPTSPNPPTCGLKRLLKQYGRMCRKTTLTTTGCRAPSARGLRASSWTRRLAIGNGGFAGGDGYLSTSSMLSWVRMLTDQRSRVSGSARSIR